jgi:rfaE bifunctional protein nucleotidyltransferase chain/domain
LKLIDLGALVAKLAGPRAAGKTVVLTNGAFDLLHVGHIRYLQAAKQLGDILVVAINDDDSVRRLKGAQRPVFPLAERMELVAALRGVDFVVSFAEDDVRQVIGVLKPDVHAKGTDYTRETVPERDAVLSYGGRVEICGDPKDHSTTSVLSRLRKS